MISSSCSSSSPRPRLSGSGVACSGRCRRECLLCTCRHRHQHGGEICIGSMNQENGEAAPDQHLILPSRRRRVLRSRPRWAPCLGITIKNPLETLGDWFALVWFDLIQRWVYKEKGRGWGLLTLWTGVIRAAACILGARQVAPNASHAHVQARKRAHGLEPKLENKETIDGECCGTLI